MIEKDRRRFTVTPDGSVGSYVVATDLDSGFWYIHPLRKVRCLGDRQLLESTISGWIKEDTARIDCHVQDVPNREGIITADDYYTAASFGYSSITDFNSVAERVDVSFRSKFGYRIRVSGSEVPVSELSAEAPIDDVVEAVVLVILGIWN